MSKSRRSQLTPPGLGSMCNAGSGGCVRGLEENGARGARMFRQLTITIGGLSLGSLGRREAPLHSTVNDCSSTGTAPCSKHMILWVASAHELVPPSVQAAVAVGFMPLIPIPAVVVQLVQWLADGWMSPSVFVPDTTHLGSRGVPVSSSDIEFMRPPEIKSAQLVSIIVVPSLLT